MLPPLPPRNHPALRCLTLLCAAWLGAGPSLHAEPATLAPGDLVAVCGDSITEQRRYSAYLETYLLACQPAARLQAAEFGWGGETAPQFSARLSDDVLVFKPTVATLCYGMNDAGYIATDEKKLATFRNGLGEAVKKLKAGGVRSVIVGTPGAVDTTTFKSFWGTPPDVYNKTLADFGAAAREIAEREGVGFADLHQTMLDAMTQAKAKRGRDYLLAGKDGIHPDENGHLVMAYAFLKALGCRGDIGTFTLDMAAGQATASEGHRVLAASASGLEIESTRYPFCFYGDDPAKPDSTRGVLEFVPFNQDLNRLRLVVEHAPAARLKVTWGKVSKEFDAAALAQGINLAAEFPDNPFSEPFKRVQDAVAKQQRYEVPMMKEMLHILPDLKKSTPERVTAFDALQTGLIQADLALREVSAAAVTPVRHEIRVEPVAP